MNIKTLTKIALLALMVFGSGSATIAQDIRIPNFWDKTERFAKPDVNTLSRLRFLTTTDFPPFNFIDRKKRLSGFHVDLARSICEELDLLNRCQIQALPWDELQEALEKGEGEAIIAGLEVTDETRKVFDFSRAYLHIPGRFITRKDAGISAPVYDALFRKKTAVVQGSAHEAYFAKIFADRTAEVFATREEALKALQDSNVDAVFSDALSLSFWLGSAASKDCCIFIDDAFQSRVFFGNGLSIALPKDRPELVQAMNYALKEISQKGKFAELYLRYFPLGLY